MPQQSAPASPLVPPPPPPGAVPKLSLGRPQPQPSGSAEASQRFIPGTRPLPLPAKPKSRLVPQLLKTGAVLIVLGVGSYFGYGWWNARREKANAESAAAANPASVPAPAEPAAPKPLPVLPATWTMDVASAKTPEGQANGTIAGTSFVVDTARIDRSGTAQVLSLRQGPGPSSDRDLTIYLHLNPGETLAGHTWTVSQEMKGAGVPQVLKRWKSSPGGALQQKSFSMGYAMKLELGQVAEGAIPGKIFLALPDPEQSVVAGMFKVVMASAESTAQPAADQAPAASVPSGGEKAAFDKRYGIKKR